MGEFAYVMARKHGWAVAGVELDPYAAEQAQERYGIDVINSAVEDVSLPEESVDVVTMWDTLEHLHYPDVVLDRVFSWLRPGGWILLRTPNANSIQARLFRECWAGYDAPRHLGVYNDKALARLISDRGFVRFRSWPMSGSYGTLVISVGFCARARPWLAGIHRFLSSPVGQVVSMPLVWILDRGGPASLTAAAMKPVD